MFLVPSYLYWKHHGMQRWLDWQDHERFLHPRNSFYQQQVSSMVEQGHIEWKGCHFFSNLQQSNVCKIFIQNLCSRKNFKPLFSAGIVLPLEFWNYTNHPMRTTHAILPRHTSPGTIKGSANYVHPLFSFLIPLGWQLGKTSRYER